MDCVVYAEVEEVIGHNDTKIISDDNLPYLVRQMAVHADVCSTAVTLQCLLFIYTAVVVLVVAVIAAAGEVGGGHLQGNLNSSGLQFELAYTSSRWHGAIHPLPKQTDFGPAVAARHVYAPANCTVAFIPQCSPGSPATTHNFSSKYCQVLIATRLPIPEGWKAELA